MSDRIYYPTQQVAIAPELSTDYRAVRGAQTVSFTENFPSQEIFQLGKLEIYATLENLPSIDLTVTKVLDGCVLAYLLATRTAATPTLLSRTQEQCKIALSIFDVAQEQASGTPLCTAEMSGFDVSALSYTFTNEGAFNESVSFIGNDIIVSEDLGILNPDAIARRDAINVTGQFTGDTDPCTFVNQRQHFLWLYDAGAGLDTESRMADPDASILPNDLPGITDSGTNELLGDGTYTASIESITISSSLSREEKFSLGVLKPSCRYLTIPVEVTCEIQYTAYNCPFVSATSEGVLTTGNDQCAAGGYNLTDQSIRVAVCDGTRIYLGRKNRLTSLNYSGGDATGGNVTVSQSYRTSNDFTDMHENDIATLAATWWASRDTYLTAQ